MEHTENEKNTARNEEKKSSGRHRPRRHRKPMDAAGKGEVRSSEAASNVGSVDAPAKGSQSQQKQGTAAQRNHNKKHRSGDRRSRSYNGKGGYETRGPIDPYQDAEETAAALAELRAMIVVKAADESPIAPAEPTEAPNETPAAPVVDSAEGALESTEPSIAELSEEAAPEAPLSQAPDVEAPIAPEEEPIEVVGIRFRSAGKIYYFDPKGITARKGDYAIVETARGPEFGDVALSNRKISPKDVVAPLRPLLRIATKEDIAHNEDNRRKEQHAFDICREKIAAHKLEMKLIEAQYAFDNSKLLFYFTSDGRVDFRELVKDLASVFRTRIELRQIGIRDEAKMLGGLGACGRPLCCATFLPDFAQVSIKMAKEQNLSLNSAKISGLCGRLMCCLRYESEVYAAEARLTPTPDSWVKTEDGVGVVLSSNPLAGTVTVSLQDAPESTPKTYHRDTVTVVPKENIPHKEHSAAAAGNAEAAPRRTASSRSSGNRPSKRNDSGKKDAEKA